MKKGSTISAEYVSPIAICTVEYGVRVPGNVRNVLKPAVVRMRNVEADSFEIRLLNPEGEET
jgi:hypothetical protein